MSPAKITTKTCLLCKQHLPIEHFDRRPSKPSHGYKASCRTCLSERGRPEIRFWKFVDTASGPEECWEWTATRNKGGYGTYTYSGNNGRRRTDRAHRYSWTLANGPIPDGLYVCHTCDNRACVRPDHLFLGTAKDNIVDAANKGRMPRGDRHPRTLLTEEAVKEIRHAYETTGKTTRELARQFGISPSSAWRIINRTVWKHVI